MAPSVGKSVPRVDGPAKAAGSARYVDDLVLPGMLHGATVRSDVARGRLLGVDLDPAFDWSGITVVTAEDVPVNSVPIIETDQPVLARDEIRHAYEPVALLACEDRLRLEKALRHVALRVEPLPPVLTIDDALAAREVIRPPDNVSKRYLITKGKGGTAGPGVVDGCEVVVRGVYESGAQEHVYIEPNGMIAFWDEEGAHVEGSLQCPYYVQKGIKGVFGLPDDGVDVTQAVTGGGFGGKEEYPTILALHALLLAKKSGRPVKLVYGRQEDVEASTKRHPSRVEIATGCDRDGTLRAVSIRVLFDGGAYVTLTPVVLSRGALHACGAYRWEDVHVEALAVATNTPPNGAFRGFGAPQTIWAIERHLDRIARTLGLDPMELRRKNLLRLGDTTATGQTLKESVGVEECVEKAIAASGFVEKRARGPVVTGRLARGIGAAVFLHGAGFTGSGEKYLKGKIAVDLLPGERALVRTASTEMGQGTETVFRQIVADALGIAVDAVDFAVPSTKNVPDSGPTVASRTVMVVGSIAERAATELRARVGQEATARGLSRSEAWERLAADPARATALVQYEPPPGVVWDDATYSGDAYPAYGWACDIAEVEVDLDTFETKVTGFWAAVDVGRVMNPTLCAGQVEGGTLQAIGWALTEKLVTRDGKILNPRMTNYIVPTSLDAPPFTTILVEAPYSRGPGGAKGVGELPMDGGAPAVAAAIEHATGLVLDRVPLLPEDLFEASLKGDAR
ncbi:MAG: xanthine dehydrogenase family protein [Holophagales bacterium]|nr:xanthine dehydrogenase family protein [Holophagales bacterium]